MTASLLSWGRYPHYPQSSKRLYWRDDAAKNLAALSAQQTTLVFGNGRSYGDSCLAASDSVLHTKYLNRFIKTDWENGVITAEAGITLEDTIALAIPHGWFLPVTPGTKFVTLGGAVANDVHGKNHHVRGTFGRYVREFGLVRSDIGAITCSPQIHTDYFKATIGGLGLTGIITWVQIQLIPIQSSQIDLTQIRFNNLNDFFMLSDELDKQHEYSVAWIDCLAQDKAIGRGIFTVGNHAKTSSLVVSKRRKVTIPLTPPISLVNKFSLKIFNTLYYHRTKNHEQRLVDYDTFFYPLDRILAWNKIYGPHGFQQYQCVIPNNNARDGIKTILEVISKSGSGSFLAVMKRCGDIPSVGVLSFPLPGISLALDFPENTSHNAKLFTQLDIIVHAAGGRLYPAKDAHMSGENFRKAYPEWSLLETLRDPALLSRFWQRVTQII